MFDTNQVEENSHSIWIIEIVTYRKNEYGLHMNVLEKIMDW